MQKIKDMLNWKFFEWITLVMMFGIYMVFFITFMKAYANGGQVIVFIDRYGEADIELAMFSILSVSSLVLLYRKAKDMTERPKTFIALIIVVWFFLAFFGTARFFDMVLPIE